MCFGGGWARAITEPAPLIYTTGWPQQREARIDPPVTFGIFSFKNKEKTKMNLFWFLRKFPI
jgi:hypothetical protein